MDTRVLIFDLDGTLVDSLPGIEEAADHALAECGLPPRSASLAALIGPPIRHILGHILPGISQDRLSQVETAFRRHYDGGAWKRTILLPNVRTTLDALAKAELPLFLATNKPSIPTRKILAELGLLPLFGEVVSPDTRSPRFASKAEILMHLAGRHGLDPTTCLYVGDTEEDVRAAQQAKMPVAIIAKGLGASNVTGPDLLKLGDISELLELIGLLEIS